MDVFAALADPVRRDLLVAVGDGPVRVVDLAARHTVSRPAISRHLRVLGEAGLVAAEDRGRERHYRLVPDALAPVTAYVAGLVEAGPPRPLVTERHLDALDLEVRRTVREPRAAGAEEGTA